jgi:hypothetical protein
VQLHGLGLTTNTETARLLDDPVTPSWRSLPITAVERERDPTERPGDADRPPPSSSTTRASCGERIVTAGAGTSSALT